MAPPSKSLRTADSTPTEVEAQEDGDQSPEAHQGQQQQSNEAPPPAEVVVEPEDLSELRLASRLVYHRRKGQRVAARSGRKPSCRRSRGSERLYVAPAPCASRAHSEQHHSLMSKRVLRARKFRLNTLANIKVCTLPQHKIHPKQICNKDVNTTIGTSDKHVMAMVCAASLLYAINVLATVNAATLLLANNVMVTRSVSTLL